MKKKKLNKRVFELQLNIKAKKKKLMENLFKNTILNKQTKTKTNYLLVV